jgi:hypothetical protein
MSTPNAWARVVVVVGVIGALILLIVAVVSFGDPAAGP